YAAVATPCCSAFNPHTLHMTLFYWKLDNKQVTIQFRGGLLGIVIPTARVFCSCCQFFIYAGVLFLLLEYSVPAVRSSLLLLASVTAVKQIVTLHDMEFPCRLFQIEMDGLHPFLANIVKSFRDAIGQSERTIQTLENMLRAFDFGGNWDVHLPVEIDESSLIGCKLVQETTDKVVLIKEKLKAARDRQKSYVDSRRKPLEFEVGDRVLLKVSPWKGVIRYGTKGKLAPRYVGPFKILKRIGPVAYRLRLPEELSSVHDTFHVSNLKKYLADANLHFPLD
nr:putative reverse transcriptase domain-containing protein [Tanacetum cinerariifolium]